MKIKEYLIDKINALVNEFPELKVSYQVDQFCKSNYIKVLPKATFDNNENYHEYETNLIIEFINNFSQEEIVFVTKDSLIEVSNPIYEIEGDLYRKEPFTVNSHIWSNSIQLDYSLTLNSSVNEIISSYNSFNEISKNFERKAINEIYEKPTILVEEEEFAFAA